MEYRWIEEIGQFKEIAAEWDAALAASDTRNPFLLSDFISAWWGNYSGSARLRILEIRDKGSVVGGIPLCLKRGSSIYGFARVLSFVGGVAAGYTEPLYSNSDVNVLSILTKALAAKNDWDVLYLSDVRSTCKLVRECRDHSADPGLSVRLIHDHDNWAMDLSPGQDGIREKMDGKLRRDLRSKRKHLVEKFGQLTFQEIKGEESVVKYFKLYSQFSRNAFAFRDRKSSLEDERYTAFLGDFLIAMDKKDLLSAHILSAGGRVAAISFGYRFGNGFDWALTGFDYELKYFRPGYLLIEDLIGYLCGQGQTYYNWFGHDRFYKNQWCDHRAPLYKLWLIRRTLRGRFYSLFQGLETMIRSNPAAVKLARKLRRV